jgi:hypothetical protein
VYTYYLAINNLNIRFLQLSNINKQLKKGYSSCSKPLGTNKRKRDACIAWSANSKATVKAIGKYSTSAAKFIFCNGMQSMYLATVDYQ